MNLNNLLYIQFSNNFTLALSSDIQTQLSAISFAVLFN